MDTSRELSPPLPDLLYAMAEEGADDETADRGAEAWAALLRDGADVAERLAEQIDASAAVTRDDIDPEDWAALTDAFGIVVKRDNRRRTVSARAFADEEDLLAEWEATKVELNPAVPAGEAPELSDDTEEPSSEPLPPRDEA